MSIQKLGPYRIERLLGQGGMGSVYAATNEKTGQPAAVKVLSNTLGAKAGFRARFESEINTMRMVKHPNIVQLLGYGEQDGHLFYAMELIDGRSLQDELKAGRHFTADEVIQYGIEMASALKLAHDSGVIHRDIKPANLMLTRDNHVKLTDFGIAKLFGGTHLTADGGVVGTVDYMPPEQAEGKPVSARSDLYSVGGVLYALLARRPPFTGRSLPQIIHALRFDPPTPLGRLAPDIPPELETIIHQLLEKDPQQRIPTALILGNRLRALEHGLRVKSADDDLDYDLKPPDESLFGGASDLTSNSDATSLSGPGGSGMPPSSASSPSSAFDMTWDHADSQAARSAPPVDRSGPTQVDSTNDGLPAAISRFTTVAEDERRRATEEKREQRVHRSLLFAKVAVGVLFAGLVGLAAFHLSRPASPDELYEAILAAANSEDSSALGGVETEIRLFLDSYADDPRVKDVQQWQQRLDEGLAQRRFDRKLSRPDSIPTLSPVERLYAEAIESAATQPEVAVARLEALLDVFRAEPPTDEPSRQSLTLAARQLERLQRQLKSQQADELTLARRQLEWATGHRESDPEAAKKVLDGLILLYQDKPWAASIVEQARAAQ